MRDRLADLTPIIKEDVTVTVENNPDMDEFFKMVGQAQGLIDRISSLVEEVQKKHNIILSAPNAEENIKQELELLNKEIRRYANSSRAKLKDLQAGQSEDENANSASVYHRIQRAQHSRLSQNFADVLGQYKDAQEHFRTRSKERIRRQLEITGQVTTDEELEEMLQSGNPAIFTSDILADSKITRQALNEIESRHQDIVRLEASIRELHEMFLDIAIMVETQGGMIENIEKNVMSATEYISQAKHEVKKAVRYQKQASRKYIIIAIAVLILLAVIALIVGLSVGLPQN